MIYIRRALGIALKVCVLNFNLIFQLALNLLSYALDIYYLPTDANIFGLTGRYIHIYIFSCHPSFDLFLSSCHAVSISDPSKL